MNAVQETFNAGASVVVAGENHGQLNRVEEIDVWLRSGITVCTESDLLPIAGRGSVTGMRFDSPFMNLIYCANELCELITRENLADWTADKEKSRRTLLVDEIVLFKEVGVTLLQFLREELTATGANLKTSPKLRKAELLHGFISSIADSLSPTTRRSATWADFPASAAR